MPPIKQKVVEWLAQVDYGDDSLYVPSEFALEFVNFMKLVNGDTPEEHKTPVVHMKMLDQIPGKKLDIINLCARGLAKALALDTLIMTPTGVIPMGDIEVGDRVIDRNGQPTQVTHVSEIFTKPAYKIILSDGSSFVASEDHLHIVQRATSVADKTKDRRSSNGRWHTKNIWKEEVLTTLELLKLGVHYNRKVTERNPNPKETKWFIPLISEYVCYDAEDTCELDPYTVGVILGDGHIDATTGIPTISAHLDDIDELRTRLNLYDLGDIYKDKRTLCTGSFRIRQIAPLVSKVLGKHTAEFKAIPASLLYGSVSNRVNVLRGLMDTDGSITPEGLCTFCSISPMLASGVVSIVKSLGGFANIKHYTNKYKGYYKVTFNLQEINPFYLKRKAQRWKPFNKYKTGIRVGIKSIEAIPDTVETKCISVDSATQSYLIDGSIVTHNTTLMAQYLILYVAVYGSIPGYGNIDYALYVSDAIENGVKKMRLRLERFCEHKEFLKQHLKVAKFTDVRWYFQNNSGQELVVTGHGARTGVRGTVELGTRPQLAILDDLIGDEDAKSPTIIASIENVVSKAIDYAMHPTKRKVIWSGTPFNAKDPLYKAVESGAWYVNVYPVCNEFPCSRKDFKGAWPDRFDYDYVRAKFDKAKQQGQLASFNQELMLRIMSKDDRLILDVDIQWYTLDLILKNKAAFNFYITTDFATSEDDANDWSVISVWAINSQGWWYWVDGICKKQLMDKNVDDLFRLAQKWKPQSVGVEVSGQQAGFVSWIQRTMMDKNIYFTLASEYNEGRPGIRPNTNKMVRFNVVVPWFKAKQMHFPEELRYSDEMIECMDELTLAAPSAFRSKHDDFIDSISMLGSLTVWRPSENVPMAKNPQTDIWEPEDDIDGAGQINSYIV